MNNWDSLPKNIIMKLDANYHTKLARMSDIKVDLRSVSETIESINKAVNVTPFQLHNFASEVKAMDEKINARMSRLEHSMYRLEHLLSQHGSFSAEPIKPPPKKKIKMVSA